MRARVSAAIGSSVFFACAPAMIAGLVPWLLTRWHGTGPPVPQQVVGGALLAVGAAVLVEAFVRFVVEGLGTPAPVAPTRHLVVGGLYRHVRNPMYLAVLAAILGQALLLGRPVLVGYAALVATAFVAFVLGYEQPALSRRFGAQYAAYRRAVPGWWPRWQPWTPALATAHPPHSPGPQPARDQHPAPSAHAAHGHEHDGGAQHTHEHDDREHDDREHDEHDEHDDREHREDEHREHQHADHHQHDHHADHASDHTDHDHDHDHDHAHRGGIVGFVQELFVPHSHDAALAVDNELEASQQGMRALLISFLALLATAVLQAGVFLISGSVALLVDTLHNVADALTAVPIAVAFSLGRRAATRRYTYGYGRAEDIAGLFVVLVIAASAALAAYEATRRLLDPRELDHLWLLALAGVIGFVGNELVARYRIRVGRSIGSAALVADGLHARTDGFTSLGVVLSAAGAALGFTAADPIVGLLITLAVLAVLRDAVRDVYRRLMDAVDPALVDQVERVARGTDGVLDVGSVRLRWIGHRLRAELDIVVRDDLSLVDAHRVAEDTEHRLLHDVPRLAAAMVHADPAPGDVDHHGELRHHRDT